MVQGRPSFLKGNRLDLYRKQFTVPPDRERTALPQCSCYRYFLKRVLHGQEMTAFFTIVKNLVSGIGCLTIDAHEMVHAIALVF